MLNPLVIKGAIYKNGDELVRPHFTGEYWLVDCTEYKTKESIMTYYDEADANNFIDNHFVLYHDGIEYYECEYSPHHTENFELLSDISDLSLFDESDNF